MECLRLRLSGWSDADLERVYKMPVGGAQMLIGSLRSFVAEDIREEVAKQQAQKAEDDRRRARHREIEREIRQEAAAASPQGEHRYACEGDDCIECELLREKNIFRRKKLAKRLAISKSRPVIVGDIVGTRYSWNTHYDYHKVVVELYNDDDEDDRVLVYCGGRGAGAWQEYRRSGLAVYPTSPTERARLMAAVRVAIEELRPGAPQGRIPYIPRPVRDWDRPEART